MERSGDRPSPVATFPAGIGAAARQRPLLPRSRDGIRPQPAKPRDGAESADRWSEGFSVGARRGQHAWAHDAAAFTPRNRNYRRKPSPSDRGQANRHPYPATGVMAVARCRGCRGLGGFAAARLDQRAFGGRNRQAPIGGRQQTRAVRQAVPCGGVRAAEGARHAGCDRATVEAVAPGTHAAAKYPEPFVEI